MRTRAFSLVFALLLLVAPVSAAQNFTVDTVHSSVVFKVKRLGVVNVYGRFNGLKGSIAFDADNPAASSVQLELQAEAVDTNNERRDNHLRSPDFFNAAQFPVINFKSTQVKKISDNSYEVTGDLSLHGVTKSMVLKVDNVGSGTNPRNGSPLIGFETKFVLKRSEFGMTYMTDALSDDVEIIIAVHGVVPAS